MPQMQQPLGRRFGMASRRPAHPGDQVRPLAVRLSCFTIVLESTQDVMHVPEMMHALSSGPEILLGRSLPELQLFAKERGQPAFRGKQLYDGLLHGVHNVLDFNNVMALLTNTNAAAASFLRSSS